MGKNLLRGLAALVLTIILSNLLSAQNNKPKNFTPVQNDKTYFSVTTPGGDNIMTFLVADFESATFPPSGWSVSGTTNWTRSTDASGYGIGAASALADFYNISSGTLNLITPVFPSAVAGDSLKFDHAYATYQTEVDKLQIYTSTNGGTAWTMLIELAGGVSGPLVTAPPTTNLFVPTSSQWATKRYALPLGTNMIKFTGVSAYGNELYLDNVVIGAPYTNDVGVIAIDNPKNNIPPVTVSPKATVKNWGSTAQSFPVTMTITPGGYTSTQNVTGLAPNASQQLTFTNWTPAVGSYNLTVVSQLGGDQNQTNDTMRATIYVSNVSRNVLLEYCTGTWCQWCPCGASTAHTLETTYPSLVVVAYHGSGSDPWINFNGNGILGALSLNAYPTGIVDRQNAPGDYTTWTGLVTNRYTNYATTPVSINIVSQNYNSSNGQLNVSLNASTNCNLTGTYSITYEIMENNLVYAQTGNGTCPGSSTFVHNHVVRNVVNGMNGETLTTTNWNAGQTISKSFSTTIPSAWIAANCQLVIYVYKGASANNMAEVQNALKTNVIPNSISNENIGIPKNFEMNQNYPNPFNPTTNIKFGLPKAGNTSLKVYNILGKEVMSMFEGYMDAGYYNCTLDASKLSSGVYFYTLTSGNYTETKKMSVVK